MCRNSVKIIYTWQCSHSDSKDCPGWAMDCFETTCPDSSRHRYNTHIDTNGVCSCKNTSEKLKVMEIQIDGKCQNCDN